MSYDIIEAAKYRTNTDSNASYRLDRIRFATTCTRCGKVARGWQSTCDKPDCQGTLKDLPTDRANWLIWPSEIENLMTGGPYGCGEAVQLANWRIFTDECNGLNWELIQHYDHATSGGLVAFDPNDEQLVEWLQEAACSLENYPVLSDDELCEVEREMWSEAVDNWLYDNALRELATSAEEVIERQDEDSRLDVKDLLDRDLPDTIRMICLAHEWYYSADDPGVDRKTVQAIGQTIGNALLPFTQKTEDQISITCTYEDQWIDYNDLRALEFEAKAV